MSVNRRADDHPWEARVRIMLAILFGLSAVAFGFLGMHMPMGVFLFACGAMIKVNLGGVLKKFSE